MFKLTIILFDVCSFKNICCNFISRTMKSIKFNNGFDIPLLGLGTWNVSDYYDKVLSDKA